LGYPENSARLSKPQSASFFAAALAWWVIPKHDRVSLTLFDQGIRKFLPPGSTRKHLHEILSTLEHNRPGSGTSLAETLARALPLLVRKGTLVILSDFFEDPAALFKALNPYLHRGFRIHLFHILDPGEIHLEDRHLSRFTDMESLSQLIVHPHSLRDSWHRELLTHTRSLRALAAARHADYALTSTTDPYFSLFDRMRD
jgi:uncharacterized protein (DUF58 family)